MFRFIAALNALSTANKFARAAGRAADEYKYQLSQRPLGDRVLARIPAPFLSEPLQARQRATTRAIWLAGAGTAVDQYYGVGADLVVHIGETIMGEPMPEEIEKTARHMMDTVAQMIRVSSMAATVEEATQEIARLAETLNPESFAGVFVAGFKQGAEEASVH
jgi:hypothetical protein